MPKQQSEEQLLLAVEKFKQYLAEDTTEAKKMWNGNSLLQRWCCGENIEFDSGRKTIPLRELIVVFMSAITNYKRSIVGKIWEGSEKLRAYMIGSPVTDADGVGKTLSFSERKLLYKQILFMNQEGVCFFAGKILLRENDIQLLKEIKEKWVGK